jgi:hypothetical protein
MYNHRHHNHISFTTHPLSDELLPDVNGKDGTGAVINR